MALTTAGASRHPDFWVPCEPWPSLSSCDAGESARGRTCLCRGVDPQDALEPWCHGPEGQRWLATSEGTKFAQEHGIRRDPSYEHVEVRSKTPVSTTPSDSSSEHHQSSKNGQSEHDKRKSPKDSLPEHNVPLQGPKQPPPVGSPGPHRGPTERLSSRQRSKQLLKTKLREQLRWQIREERELTQGALTSSRHEEPAHIGLSRK